MVAVTKDRKHTKQTSRLKRGQKLKNATTDAMSPTIITAINIRELDESQNSVGANQYRVRPKARATAAR